MSWWDYVPALTPVAAWEAISTFTDSGQLKLQDKVGTKHVALRNSNAQFFPGDIDYLCIKGGDDYMWPMDAQVNVPTAATIVFFCKHVGRGLAYYKEPGDPSSYFMDQESSGYFYQYNNNTGGAVGTAPAFGEWKFMALSISATDARMYCNGAWAGATFSRDWIPPHIKGMGYYTDGNEYNLGGSERFVAGGVWSGAATLEELQTLESAIRDALAQTQTVSGVSGSLAVTRHINNDLALIPGQPPTRSGLFVRGCKNLYHKGGAVISGVVTVENVPAARKVRIFDRGAGLLWGETMSTPNGAFTFENLDPEKEYFVVAFDHLRTYNAVISDMMVP